MVRSLRLTKRTRCLRKEAHLGVPRGRGKTSEAVLAFAKNTNATVCITMYMRLRLCFERKFYLVVRSSG